MNTKVTMLAALISSLLLLTVQIVIAQTNPPPSATATRPAKTGPEHAHTGEGDHAVRRMETA